jgi:hypothetical protein
MEWARNFVRIGTGELRREFWWGNMREKDRLVDLKVDGKIIVNWSFKKWYREHENWFCIVRARNRWLALVNAVMNLRF